MLFLLVRLQAIGDTGFDVVPDDELADASEGFMNRRNLGEGLDAGGAFLDHPAESPDLPLDDAEAPEGVFLDPFVNNKSRTHLSFIPYPGGVYQDDTTNPC